MKEGVSRLWVAMAEGGLVLPEAGDIAVFAPRAGADLTALPLARCHIISDFKPDHDHFAGLGFQCFTKPQGRYSAALILLPRAKALARALVAQAAAVTDGVVIVDGAKTDGVESLLRDCRKRVAVLGPVSKAHGKVFWLNAGAGFDDWAAGEAHEIEGGFITAPGVFSADGIDPASQLLADHLPRKLGARVADLGGGWGYLSARALERQDIVALDLVEAGHGALDCARRNIADTRVKLHWADACVWRPEVLLDTVICNPPFHTARAADPDLGRGFIRAAAAMLKPAGQLWLVANRHLAYETTLAECFTEVTEIAGDNRFKLLRGFRPSRKRR
ncbi:16S rRNA (guanine(1207)-N(2))-methyltransferase [hydrothermal vent metagenome]|uniref:16S rRNA (Guanine(1207)-N(2))-methyltransferase n=1 Tax=hydrothermal vent metagenome TaxID=652676 RepID=A0A3B0S157_9ZZZZ